MLNAAVILVLLAIIIPAVYYIVKEKKKGRVCIGCPAGCKCNKNSVCAQKACLNGGNDG